MITLTELPLGSGNKALENSREKDQLNICFNETELNRCLELCLTYFPLGQVLVLALRIREVPCLPAYHGERTMASMTNTVAG